MATLFIVLPTISMKKIICKISPYVIEVKQYPCPYIEQTQQNRTLHKLKRAERHSRSALILFGVRDSVR